MSSNSGARGFTPLGKVVSDRSGVLMAARSEASGALVDVRILAPALKAARTFMRRLGGEMNVLSEVRHTNLVSVMYFDKNAGAVVYESVPGSTLTQLLDGGGSLEVAASLVLLEDCISGLEALHNVGVLHGNLTPDSVVVETTGAVLLRDAGLSVPDAAAADLTPEQRPYLAPEVLAGGPPTSSADLYAATAIFVESLGGRASQAAIRTDLRPLLSEGMSMDPSKRSATLDDFRRELDDYARATIGETWRKDGRALLVVAAAAQATRAIRVSSPSDHHAEGADEATAAVALMRSPAPRDPRLLAGLGALGFVALLAVIVLLRAFVSTGQLSPSALLPSNFIPNLLGAPSSPSASPSAGPIAPATSAGANGSSTVVPPISNPTTKPTSGSRPTGAPPTPNPTGPPLISQSIAFTSTPSSPTYSGSYLVAASGGASGNPVLFSSTSTTVCKLGVGSATFDFVGVGTCTIQATQAGNSRYTSASNAQSFAVAQAPQKIAFTTTPTNPTYNGPSYTVEATAAGGAVTFSADSSSVACGVTPTGTVTFTAAGDCTIDATQAGNANYSPAPPVQQTFIVAKASQTITITSSPPCNPCLTQTPYALSGTASSGLTVTFGIDASSTPGSCSISGNTVTLNGGLNFPGNCVIDWFQSGNQDYAAAAVQQQTVAVT